MEREARDRESERVEDEAVGLVDEVEEELRRLREQRWQNRPPSPPALERARAAAKEKRQSPDWQKSEGEDKMQSPGDTDATRRMVTRVFHGPREHIVELQLSVGKDGGVGAKVRPTSPLLIPDFTAASPQRLSRRSLAFPRSPARKKLQGAIHNVSAQISALNALQKKGYIDPTRMRNLQANRDSPMAHAKPVDAPMAHANPVDAPKSSRDSSSKSSPKSSYESSFKSSRDPSPRSSCRITEGSHASDGWVRAGEASEGEAGRRNPSAASPASPPPSFRKSCDLLWPPIKPPRAVLKPDASARIGLRTSPLTVHLLLLLPSSN